MTLADGESLRRVSADDYDPRGSSYLGGGYKVDDFELINVLLGEKIVFGSVRVNEFFPPMNGEFHLSAAMASIWLMQLGTVYSFYDIDVPKKDREIYLRSFSMRCRKRIVELNDIVLEIEILSKAAANGTIVYRARFDIDVGSFNGEMGWFMSARPLAG